MTAQAQQRPSRAGIIAAAGKIAQILPATPLLPIEVDGRTIWCKAECLQPIGAFKIRGAWHRLTDLDEAQKKAGVVAFSSGNHAQGVAWAARRLNIPAAIVMPSDAPAAKLEGTARLGAEIILYDRAREDRVQIGETRARERGAVLVPSFDDPWIIEGQGTAAYEAEKQLSDFTGRRFDSIVACCGGGGLASGCALALPDAQVHLVEPEGWADMGESLERGYIVPVGENAPSTICDALQTKQVAELTFGILKERGAHAYAVSDDEAKAAMAFAFHNLRVVLEPGGAVALAAVLTGRVKPEGDCLLTLSGGNVDPALFSSALSA